MILRSSLSNESSEETQNSYLHERKKYFYFYPNWFVGKVIKNYWSIISDLWNYFPLKMLNLYMKEVGYTDKNNAKWFI